MPETCWQYPFSPISLPTPYNLQAKDNALRSLTKRYLAYSAAVESSSEEECKALYEGLMLEVDQYELAVSKAEALVETNVRQVAEYDAMQQRVEAEM